MKTKSIEEQIEEVLIAWLKSGNENTTKASFLIGEVCKRYAIEVANEKDEEITTLKRGIKKFCFHWKSYFSNKVVGNPPSIKDLEDLIL